MKSAAPPWQRWTMTLMRTPQPVIVEAQSFEDTVAEAQKQLEAWVPKAQWSGYTTGTVDA
jgi:hypothetical protein